MCVFDLNIGLPHLVLLYSTLLFGDLYMADLALVEEAFTRVISNGPGADKKSGQKILGCLPVRLRC